MLIDPPRLTTKNNIDGVVQTAVSEFTRERAREGNVVQPPDDDKLKSVI